MLFMVCCVFLGVYWCVCSFICLSVGVYGTTDKKVLNFRGSGSSVGRVFACVCICWYDLYVGGYGTIDIKLLNFCY